MFSNHSPGRPPGHLPKAALSFRSHGCGSEKIIAIDRSAVIGRNPTTAFRSKKGLATLIEDSDMAVLLDDAHVSRQHARIDYDEGRWSITDLGSHSGTYVNGSAAGQSGLELKGGDSVFIGAVGFSFWILEEAYNPVLLVGNSGYPPLPVENNLRAMAQALRARKQFQNHPYMLWEDETTRPNIIAYLGRMSSVLTEDSLSIFYYAGHGSKEGLCIHGGFFTPGDLSKALENMRGSKFVFLDCCNSSIFLGCRSSNTLIVSGESPEKQLFFGHVTQFANKAGMARSDTREGFLTRAFIKILSERAGKIDLQSMADELQEYHKLQKYEVKTFSEGPRIVIGSVIADPARLGGETPKNL